MYKIGYSGFSEYEHKHIYKHKIKTLHLIFKLELLFFFI